MSEASQTVVEVAGLSRQGRRSSNEDAADWKAYPPGGSLAAWAVVCDGMGGHNAGEVASAMVLRRFQAHLGALAAAPEPDPDLRSRVVSWVKEANEEVLAAGRASVERKGMGTTLAVALVVRPRRLLVANIGDSKVFLVRGAEARQLSVDHTAIAEQRRALGKHGPPTKEDSSSPFAHALTRSLGGEDEPVPDVTDLVELEEGDLVVLTSDGVTDVLDPPDLAVAVERARGLSEVPEALYTAAYEGGSRDNITAVGIAFGGPLVRRRPAATELDETAPTAVVTRPIAVTRPMAATAASVAAPGPRPRAVSSSPRQETGSSTRTSAGSIVALVVAALALLGAAALVLVVPRPGALPAAVASASRPEAPVPLPPDGPRLVEAAVVVDGVSYVFYLGFDREVADLLKGRTPGLELRHARVPGRGNADLMGHEGVGAPYPWRFRGAEGEWLSYELEQAFTVFAPGTELGPLGAGERLVLELASGPGAAADLSAEATVDSPAGLSRHAAGRR